MGRGSVMLLLTLIGAATAAGQELPELPTQADIDADMKATAAFFPKTDSAGQALPPIPSAALPEDSSPVQMIPIGAVPAPGETEKHEAQSSFTGSEEINHSTRFWLRGEFLLWWLDNPRIPVLVATGPSTSPRPGALDDPFTMIRFGGGPVETHEHFGARFAVGYWFDEHHQWAAEVNYFFLANRSIRYDLASPGNPIIARPFFNALIQQPDSSLTTYPALARGGIHIDAPIFLDGAEANFFCTLNQCPDYPIRALAGLRYTGLYESLGIREESQVLATAKNPFAGNHITVTDSFDCDNSFFGTQVGLSATYRLRRLEVEAVAKVALGDSHESVRIHGSTSIDTQPATFANAGLLAVASNSGRHSRDAFAVVPEFDLNGRFQITERLKATLGFSFVYWSSVLRPGDQVDTRVNPALVPTSNNFGSGVGPAQPAVPFRTTDFWAFGLNVGLEFSF